jgi:acyl-CoA synthetase (AMP-forming)/AMP-acid ligase II
MPTHAGVIAACRNVSDMANLAEGDSFVIVLPLFHVAGSGCGIASLYAGAKVVLMRVPEPAEICRRLAEERITHTFLVPVLLEVIARNPPPRDVDFTALRRLFYGASPISPLTSRAAIQIFPGCSPRPTG